MKEYMAKMIARMEKAGKTGEVIQMHHVFKACASDVITVYAFGECFGFMDTPDFGRAFFESTDVFFFLTHVFGLVPWLVHYVQNVPSWVIKTFLPWLSELRDRQDVRRSLVLPFFQPLACLFLEARVLLLTMQCSGGSPKYARSAPRPTQSVSRAPSSRASSTARFRRKRRPTKGWPVKHN